VYGSTEAEPVAHIDAAARLALDPGARGFCTGTPSSLVRMRVIRIRKGPIAGPVDWATWELPQGEIGELVVAGDHVCKDYFRNPEAVGQNKLCDPAGCIWHRMGDTGYLDRTGRFWLVGRVHSTIVRNGVDYHAQLIEQEAGKRVPHTGRIAALGVPHPQLGEAIVLVVEGDRPRTVALGPDVPVDRVVAISKLPLDPRHKSKIDYSRLREMVGA
jgi:acyl-CoA synthetase (AMP-forming)/AMP-acid ligase II